MKHIALFEIFFLSLIAPAHLFLIPATYAQSSETIIIGNGLPEIEVNLDSIKNNESTSKNTLRHVGQIQNSIKLKLPENFSKQHTPKKLITTKMKSLPVEKVSRKKITKEEVNIKPKNNLVKNKINIIRENTSIQSKKPLNLPKNVLENNNRNTGKKTKLISSSDRNSSKTKIARIKNSELDSNKLYRIIFLPSETRLDEKYIPIISKIANSTKTSNSRVQIKAFASTVGNRPTYARRVSLSRALAVRSQLIQLGVNSTLIDVRALGEPQDGNLSDRVDVLIKPQ